MLIILVQGPSAVVLGSLATDASEMFARHLIYYSYTLNLLRGPAIHQSILLDNHLPSAARLTLLGSFEVNWTAIDVSRMHEQ